jgi:uncharacterized protein
MLELSFKTLEFKLKGQELTIILLNNFQSKVIIKDKITLIDKNTIKIDSNNDKKAELAFLGLLSQAFDNLENKINGNKAIYIHQNLGIPLIGNFSFGIVYRNTTLIEIKPSTSCNLNCIYCSVGEGKSSHKTDFVVEKDYLVKELKKLINFVNEPVEVHIGVHGEPFLYADLIPLIADLNNLKEVKTVSMDTNFTLVSKSIIDQLSKFEKLRINISLDAMDEEIANKMAGTKYNLKYVLSMIEYAHKKGLKILLAPLYVPGYNDLELAKIVQFAEKIGLKEEKNHPVIGIQNFLNYKTGRNPVKAIPWKDFYQKISLIPTKYKLRLTPEDFAIKKAKTLPKPFKVGDLIQAELVCEDRFKDSSIAVFKDRTISVPNCPFNKNKKVKLKIIRDKHNIFTGNLTKSNI